jgi:hypothetical protein
MDEAIRQTDMLVPLPAHLKRLEAESIEIMREVAAEFRNPVMLYSIGKDSSVMLHLALKAFHPSPPPFPMLHVDTTWKFREMIARPPLESQADRPHQQGRHRPRHRPVSVGLASLYPCYEDRRR